MANDYSVTIRRSDEKLVKQDRCTTQEKCATKVYPRWYVDQLTQARYGTDVPALRCEIDDLKNQLSSKNDDYSDLKYKYRRLRHYYRRLYEAYERLVSSYWEDQRKCRCGSVREITVEETVIKKK